MSPSKIMNCFHFFIRRDPKSDNSLSTTNSKEQLINFEHKKKEILLDNEKTPEETVTSILKPILDNNSVDLFRPLFKEGHSLNKQTSFLLCIYYFKFQHSHNPDFKQLKLNSSSLEEWVDGITGQHIKLSQEIVNQIKYKDGIITINSKTFNNPIINLNKYSKTSYFFSNPKYTTKPDKYKIGEIYHNADGVCDEITTYVLEARAKAKKNPEQNKRKDVINLLKNLKSKEGSLISNDTRRQLEDIYYTKSPTITSLFLIKKFNILNHNMLEMMINLSEIMNNDSCNNIFIKCRTFEHAVYLEITKYGDYFKYLYYEPNDKKLWFSMYFHKRELKVDGDRINSFYSYMKFFEFRKNDDTQVALEVYSYPTDTPRVIEYELNVPIDSYGQKQLILIAIATQDERMFREIIQQKSLQLDLDFYHRNATPLILAIEANLYNTTKLLLEHGANIHLRKLPLIGIAKTENEFKKNDQLALAIIDADIVYKTTSGYLKRVQANDFYASIQFFYSKETKQHIFMYMLQKHIDSKKNQLYQILPTLVNGISPLDAASKLGLKGDKIYNLISQHIKPTKIFDVKLE